MKVLIVVDMQNDFIDGSLGTLEAVRIVPHVVEKIRAWEGPVYVTQDTHFENYLQTQEGRALPVEHCIQNTSGWQIAPAVRAALGQDAVCLAKPTFGSRELAEALAKLEEPIDEIELIGLCTDICVISNALLLKAYFPEMKISVDASCCAGVTPKTHEAALETMRMCQIDILGE